MKTDKTKIIRIILIGICIFVLLFSPLVAYPKLIKAGEEKFAGPTYKGILELWQLDVFEGGSGSRADFLTKRAVKFEKENEGVLISVKRYTVSEAEEKFALGEYPDMISYGAGFDCALERAIEISVPKGVSDKYLKGGVYNGKQYAVPWCAGGYILIGRGENSFSENKLSVNEGEYNLPMIGCLSAGLNYEVTKGLSLNNYTDFVSGKQTLILGTQRDVVRVENKGLTIAYKSLSGFTDLLQYISVTADEGDKIIYCEMFIEFLLSEESQSRLTDIDMFSVTGVSLYSEGGMKVLEDSLKENFNTISVFNSSEVLSECRALADKAYGGDEEARKKVENILL